MHPLIILGGPTASGKSKTALVLAEHFGTEIISADSMQVYRHFDIGTAKPAPEERQRVKHHLIDILEPEEEFTAFEFKERALACIRDLRRRGKTPVMVGGTGLYLKTLLDNHNCAISVSPDIRRKVQEEIQEKGTRVMHAQLANVDPVYASRIQPTDPARIERALSVHRQTGKPLSEYHADDAAIEYEFESYLFVLECDRKNLYERIDQRVDHMMEQGLREEVASLLDRGYPHHLKPFQSIGYSQMISHLQGNLPLEQAEYEIKRETRHFAKRQLTWFKKMAGRIAIVIDPLETARQIKEKILTHLPAGAALMLGIWLALGLPVTAAADMDSQTQWQTAVRSFHAGKLDEAKEQFQKFLQEDVDPKTRNRARFLLGKIFLQQGDYIQAETLLSEMAKEYREMGDYVGLDLAHAQFGKGEWQAALDQGQNILDRYPHTLLGPQLHLVRAEAFEKLGEYQKTLDELEIVERQITRKLTTRDWKDRIPEIMKRQIQLAKHLQNHKETYRLLRKLYIREPREGETLQAKIQMNHLEASLALHPQPLNERETRRRFRNLLNEVEYLTVIQEILAMQREAGEASLPPDIYFYWAEAYKGLRKRPRANSVLEQYLKKYPDHRRRPEAHFLIAGNLWNLGNPNGALAHIQTLVKEFPHSRWVPQALFYQGRIYEDIRQPGKAIATYDELAGKFSQETYGEMAAWRTGWVHYKAGEWQQAYERFQNNINRLPKGSLTDKNLFWMAKTAMELERSDEAQLLYKDLAERFPFTYYGLQASKYLNEHLPGPFETKKPFQKASYKIENGSFTKPGRALSRREQFHFKRGSELIELGFQPEARVEFLRLGRSIPKNLSGVLWLSHWYNQAGAYSDSMQVLQLYKDYKTIHGERDLPKGFWVNFYPSAYSEYVETETAKYDLDPRWVKGLIRQESMYNSKSLSPAGARGLMQIMPKTGKRLFEKSFPNETFDEEDLFKPEININLGVLYLNDLARKLEGNGVHILITYNAGPKVLKAWLKRFRSLEDVDVFIESIPYPETRGYVKHVMRNYGIYKTLYPSPDEPMSGNKSF